MSVTEQISDDDAPQAGEVAWNDAVLAAAMFVLDPPGFGGIVLRARPGPARNAWVDRVREWLPASCPMRKLPPGIDDDRLLGGLDIAATLRSGKPVAQTGLLAQADGGVLVVPMAERLPQLTRARLTAVLDTRRVDMQRDGFSRSQSSSFGVIALDEGADESEAVAPTLADRLAFHSNIDGVSLADLVAGAVSDFDLDADDIAAAQRRLNSIHPDDEILEGLTAIALAFGVSSVRATLFALHAAKASAALDGRDAITQDDLAVATRLVIVPRATQIPSIPDESEPEQPEPEQDPDETPPDNDTNEDQDLHDGPLPDQVIAAVAASLPAGLLASLTMGQAMGRAGAADSGKGAHQRGKVRGRALGAVRGRLGNGARLSVVDTLRAAIPFQAVRASAHPKRRKTPGKRPPLQFRADDIRIKRFEQYQPTLTIFAVDASGSAALHRLGEAKGAVELLLADCYARRDEVALIVFRGETAELILPPTRSLVRAQRCMSGVPGGGGTPLAAGIEAACALATDAGRKGLSPKIVVLTDGRANIGHDPASGRAGAAEDAMRASRMLAASGVPALLLDTSPRGNPQAKDYADAMQAAYCKLPVADAERVVAMTRDPAAAAVRE